MDPGSSFTNYDERNEMEDYTIYALKNTFDPERDAITYSSLQEGVGRFGWSYVETADLFLSRTLLPHRKERDMTSDEQKQIIGDLVIQLDQSRKNQVCLREKINQASKTLASAANQLQQEDHISRIQIEEYPTKEQITNWIEEYKTCAEDRKRLRAALEEYGLSP